MTRTNVMLVLALVASCLYLVKVSYESRRLFSALDRAGVEATRLASDHERLLSERQAQATPLRIERVAREKLSMRSPTPAVTEYVTVPKVAATAMAASAASTAAPASSNAMASEPSSASGTGR